MLILNHGRGVALATVAELLDGADGKSLEDRFLEIVER